MHLLGPLLTLGRLRSRERATEFGQTIGRRSLAGLISGLTLLATPSWGQLNGPESPAKTLKHLSLEELMDVEVISVSKRPEKLLEAASAIQVVTNDDIRRSGATLIPDALRLAGNLHVTQKSAHAWGISARGFNTDLANKLLVLIDGRTVYTPLYSGVFWDRQDYLLEDIDRIEVISGPGGSLWGANAVNGVINIITKSAEETHGVYVEGGGGSDVQGFTGIRYGGKLAPTVSYRVYGKYFDRDQGVFSTGVDARDSWRMKQGGFRIDAGTSAADKLTFQGDVYSGDEDLVTGGTGKVSGGNLLGRWTRSFSQDAEMSLQVYYDRTHLTTPAAAFAVNGSVLAPAGIFSDDLDTYDVDFQHRFRLGTAHQVVWGVGYRFTHDEVRNAPSLAFFPPILDRRLFSAFVQEEARLSEDLSFTVGTKVERNDYTGWEWEPSARLQWSFTDKQMLWAAVSRAVRMPSRIDRDVSQPAPPYFVILRGGKDFISESVVAYELGYRAQLGPRLATSVSTFYNEYQDVRSTSLSPPAPLPFPLFFENNLEGHTHGLELNGSLLAHQGWRLHASYVLFRENVHVAPGRLDFNQALNETADPRHQFQIRSSMDLTETLELDASLRWVDDFVINSSGVAKSVPSYSEMDVRLAWHAVEGIELSVVGQNLLHDRHPEYGAPGPSRQDIQRSVYGKVTWRF